MDINKKIKGKIPCIYNYFVEIKPSSILDTNVVSSFYQTELYRCIRFYKRISSLI